MEADYNLPVIVHGHELVLLDYCAAVFHRHPYRRAGRDAVANGQAGDIRDSINYVSLVKRLFEENGHFVIVPESAWEFRSPNNFHVRGSGEIAVYMKVLSEMKNYAVRERILRTAGHSKTFGRLRGFFQKLRDSRISYTDFCIIVHAVNEAAAGRKTAIVTNDIPLIENAGAIFRGVNSEDYLRTGMQPIRRPIGLYSKMGFDEYVLQAGFNL